MIPDRIDPEDVATGVHKLAEMEDVARREQFGPGGDPPPWITAVRVVCERALEAEADEPVEVEPERPGDLPYRTPAQREAEE